MYQRNYNRIGSKNSALCLRSLPLSLSLSLPHSGETVIDHGSGEERGGKQNFVLLRHSGGSESESLAQFAFVPAAKSKSPGFVQILPIIPQSSSTAVDTREIVQQPLSSEGDSAVAVILIFKLSLTFW